MITQKLVYPPRDHCDHYQIAFDDVRMSASVADDFQEEVVSSRLLISEITLTNT